MSNQTNEGTDLSVTGQHSRRGEPQPDQLRHEQADESQHEDLDTGQVPGTAAMSSQFAERPSDEAIAEIEAERTHRMQHRPPHSEVNNTHRTFDAELGRFEDCEDPIHFEHKRR